MLTGMVAANLLYDSLLVAAMLRHVVVPLYKQRESYFYGSASQRRDGQHGGWLLWGQLLAFFP